MASSTATSTAKNKTLVVVESPSKAKTINKYLGKDYLVFASVGHIRDLPRKEIGLDFDNHYEPRYEVIAGKEKVVRQLKKLSGEATDILIATDPDREGEAIAWHIASEVEFTRKPVHRVLFNEITKNAILEAIDQPRDIDHRLVRSQQTRQGLDKIVGYKISPFLWNVVFRGLSAGRVQSVALRLICEREDEIERFEPKEYWTLIAEFRTVAGETFSAKLVRIDGKKVDISNREDAERTATAILSKIYGVTAITPKVQHRKPPLAFTTSLLQQAASNQLGFGSKKTMRVAQQLYEGIDIGPEGATGLITYMRTDSTRVGAEATEQAQRFITEEYGADYSGSGRAAASGKKTQDAHEAIRPTSVFRTPAAMKRFLSQDQYRLYELVWKRFLASRMAPAKIEQTSVEVNDHEKRFLFRASGSKVLFPGFLKVYGDQKELDYEARKSTRDEDEGEQMVRLPEKLSVNERLDLSNLQKKQSFTRPPARYTEASLVKELDNYGIGRPSTYATIFSTLQERRYVELQKKRITPTELGRDVSKILIANFPDIFNVAFTAHMETELDKVAAGEDDYEEVLDSFYKPLETALSLRKNDPLLPQNADAETCDKCGKGKMVVKWTASGKFLGCSRYPSCKNVKPLSNAKPKPQDTGVSCPGCSDGRMLLRNGRFGPFLACSNYPDCNTLLKLDKQRKIEPPKTPPLETDLPCPKCGSPLYLRTGKRGPWLGCSKFPKCRGRQAWGQLDPDVRENWEKELAKHRAAHPDVTILMADGTAAVMEMTIDDIIAVSEEKGLIQTTEAEKSNVKA